METNVTPIIQNELARGCYGWGIVADAIIVTLQWYELLYFQGMLACKIPIHAWVRPAAHFFLDYSEKYTTFAPQHYTDAIMSAMASQITSLTTLYSTVYWGTVQWKHRSSASLAFVRGILRWPLNSPHKRPVTRNKFPFNYAILKSISRYLPGIRRQHMEYYFFLKSVWLSFQRVTIHVAKFWSASHCITTYHFYFLRRWKAICE